MQNHRLLKFTVTGQKISKDKSCDFSGIIKGTSGYLYASFIFSKEWKGCKVAASFYCLNKEYAVPVINSQCEIPKEALAWDSFEVKLTGAKENFKITTNKEKVTQEE